MSRLFDRLFIDDKPISASNPAPKPKEKRRIVPTFIPDDSAKPAAVFGGGGSTAVKKYRKSIDVIEAKARAEESDIKMNRKDKRHNAHGQHWKYLDNFNDYVKHYTKIAPKSKSQTLREWLRKQYDAKKYFSTKTNRWRKY